MLKRLLVIIWVLTSAVVYAQGAYELRQMGQELRQGDKSALYRLGAFFSDAEKVPETLGYHQLTMSRGAIAKREVKEMVSFLPTEIDIEKASKKSFTAFLDSNYSSIHYDALANVYLITPLENRSVSFNIKELKGSKQKLYQDKRDALMRLYWVTDSDIKRHILAHEPVCLKLIAAHLYAARSGWDHYYFSTDDDIQLLNLLTQTEIAIPDEHGELTYLYENDYSNVCYLNLLIFFSQNYKDYAWDNTKGCFVNPKLQDKIKPADKLDDWFTDMYNSADHATAISAFVHLTEANPDLIAKMAPKYQDQRDFPQYGGLPTFEDRFLIQLSKLTDYCRQNGIDYKGNGTMLKCIESLKRPRSFKAKRKLEDSLVNSLTLDNITSFEYWALIYESGFDVTYSAGYIIDRFYSKHFDELLNDDKQLALYLKKAALFDKLGIIGVCNLYANKFTSLGDDARESLDGLPANDADIVKMRIQALAYTHVPQPKLLIMPVKLKMDNALKPVNNNHSRKLDNMGIRYKNPNGTLNFDRVYEELKYGVVNALAGGGGSTDEDVANPLVKMLEKVFDTGLGYEGKVPECYPPCKDDLFDAPKQAYKWMVVLEQNNLLKEPHDEPMSLGYFDN